jgi:hypothetical protein
MFSIPTVRVTSKNHPVSENDFLRFLKCVNIQGEDECWLWRGRLDKHKYGVFSIKHTLIKAHRLSYLSWYGYINNELQVCHKCDNPSCVNPFHLWQGTQADNNKDRDLKGRTRTGHLYGSEHPMSKLTNEDVIWIRENYNPNIWSTRKLAKKFGVCQTNIRHILACISWKVLK